MKYTVYGNKKSKIAHNAAKRNDACRQAVLRKENIQKFETLAQAEEVGYRACKRCKPA